MSSGFLKIPVPAASRAAANQTVPRSGIAYPAVITPPVLQQQGILQLKIDKLLDNGSDKQAIERYMKGAVNSRGQTFEQAVEEVMVLFPALSDKLAISKTWLLLKESLSGEKIDVITDCIIRLSKDVNTIFMEHTPYPNLRSHDLRPDKPFTIPQSEKSQERSETLYKEIDKEAKRLFELVKKEDNGAKTKLGNLLRYDKEHDTYKGYMLGVLIMDGQVFATCSGGQSAGFELIAKSLGMQYVSSVMNVEEARGIIVKEIGPHSFGTGEEKNIVKEHTGSEEVKTGLAGTCAAPKLIWSIIDGGHVKLHPTTMQHASMTERWVSPLNADSTVPIIDAHGKIIKYGSGDIVPSCKACQHLMHGLEERLQRRLDDSKKMKSLSEQENSAENIERKRVAKEQKQALDREYESQILTGNSGEVQALNLALENLLNTIIKGDDSILKDELSFLRSSTDRLEELRFDLRAFAKIPLGDSRAAVLDTLERLKEGQRVIATMVDGINQFWATQEKPAAASSGKGGATEKRSGKNKR